MTRHELRNDILAYCLANRGDEATIAKFSRFFKEGYHGYGLSSPIMYAKVKELVKNPEINLRVALDTIPELMMHGLYEEISIGLLLVDAFHKQFTHDTFKEVEGFYRQGITNWAHADTLGMFILPKFFKMKIVSLSDFSPWLTADNKFQRRSVPVTMRVLLKTTPDFTFLFQFIEPLILDKDREVHQGVGWFLRDAWKVKRPETEAFLLKWKDTSPRLIIQYATEKMTAGEKIRFKKEKN